MHLGALAAGEAIAVKVSSLSAANATKRASVEPGVLVATASLGAAGEGLENAPIFLWPTQKRFDDVPMVVGWSAAKKSYTTVYTNENGGTTQQCGGGEPTALEALLARYGRASDIETMYLYGATPKWMRCPERRRHLDGGACARRRRTRSSTTATATTTSSRTAAATAGTCGTAVAEKADGNMDGLGHHEQPRQRGGQRRDAHGRPAAAARRCRRARLRRPSPAAARASPTSTRPGSSA